MFKVIHFGSLLTRSVSRNAVKRFFLSEAYKCEEAWAHRLSNPLFSKIDFSSMYHDLDIVFQKKQRVSVVDVDILLTCAQDPAFKNEVEDVLLRIRLCPECSILPERATHAAIRYLMHHSPKEDFFNTLSDRINYGLFPSHHLTNLLMDTYLTEGDPVSAAKVAVLQMLQEDFSHPITKPLALHCCYNYLHSPHIWTLRSEPDPDAGKEPIKVRVRFLRNPYFDDHFDIQVPNHLLGKTLWLFGHSLGGPLGASSQLVGLVLYEKYDKCLDFLERAIASKTKLHEEAVVKAKEYAVKKPKQEEGEGEGEGKEGDVEGDVEGGGSKGKLLELLGGLDESALLKGSLLELSGELVKEAVKEHEAKDIEQLCQTYKEWEAEREEDVEREVKRARKVKAMEEIRQMREEMEKEEERLFFFDKEDEVEVVAEENMAKKASLRTYQLRGKEKMLSGEEYIPPTF